MNRRRFFKLTSSAAVMAAGCWAAPVGETRYLHLKSGKVIKLEGATLVQLAALKGSSPPVIVMEFHCGDDGALTIDMSEFAMLTNYPPA